jgi:hypothetical protein
MCAADILSCDSHDGLYPLFRSERRRLCCVLRLKDVSVVSDTATLSQCTSDPVYRVLILSENYHLSLFAAMPTVSVVSWVGYINMINNLNRTWKLTVVG